MAISTGTAVGIRVGTRLMGGLLNYERRLQALRSARVTQATDLMNSGVRAAARASLEGVNSAKEAAKTAVNRARMQGNRVVSAAKKAAQTGIDSTMPALRAAHAELGYAKRGMRTATAAYRRQLQSVVQANPMRNFMAGGRAFTQEEMARVASGGAWRRAWDVAARYRAEQMRPGFEAVARRFRPVFDNLQAASDIAYRHLKYAREASRSAITAGRNAVLNAHGMRQQMMTAARLHGQESVRAAGVTGGQLVRNAMTTGRASIARAGEMTGVRGAVVATGDAIRKAGSSVAGFVKPVTSYIGKSLNGGVRGVGSAVAESRLVRWPVNILAYPGKTLLNGVEKAGTRVFSNATRLGRAGRALTSAKGNAAAFAIGAWVEAGMNAYDFFKDNDNVDYLKENGILKTVGEAVTSKRYWAEVGKGIGRGLTLGFWGGGDDTALDRWAGDTRDGEDNRNSQMNDAMVQGRNPVTGEVVQGAKAREEAFKYAKDLIDTHNKRMAASPKLMVREGGFRGYYSSLVAERDKALARAKDIAESWDNGGSQRAHSHGTADEYLASAMRNLNNRYDAYFAAAMKNPEAKNVLDENRAAAYSLYFSGRDYAKDYELAGKDPNAVKGFAEFNELWNQLDDTRKVLWDPKHEKELYDSARRAAVIKLRADLSKEAGND